MVSTYLKTAQIVKEYKNGLFPALPLGGDEEALEAYQRVKLREYLVSLAQMHE